MNYKKSIMMLLSMPSLLQADFDPCTKIESGFSKYSLGTIHLQDASNNPDYIHVTKTKFMPMVRGFLGYEYNDFGKLNSKDRTTGRFGIQLEYTHRTDGVRGDYYDYGFDTSTLYTLQSVNRVDLQGCFEYDFARLFYCDWVVGVGVGVSHNVLKNLRIYETDNNAFAGQALAPHAFSPSGYLSFGFKTAFDSNKNLFYHVSYHLGIAGVSYKKLIVQTQPDPNASLAAQNAFNLLNNISVYKAPSFAVFSQELSLGVQWDF